MDEAMRRELVNEARTPDPSATVNFGKFIDGHRQLRRLDKDPTAKDARPKFYYDTLSEEEQYASPPPPYRVLRWHPTTGEEVCATTPDQLAAYEARGYVSFPPNQHPTTVNDAIAAELASLSPEDRALVLASAKQTRMDALTKKLAGLSDADLATVSAAEKPAGKRKAG